MIKAVERYLYEDTERGVYLFRRVTKGRSFKKTIGKTSEVSLFAARLKVAELLEQQKSKSWHKRVDDDVTFAEILPDALDAIIDAKAYKEGGKSENQWRQTMRDYALPVIGDMAVRDIKTRDIVAVIKPIWREKTVTANRLFGRLREVFYHFCRIELISQNPCDWNIVKQCLPPKAKVHVTKHHAAPTLEELQKVVAYCIEHPSLVSGALLVIIATACRVSECRKATWSEFDLENCLWYVPAEHQKVQDAERQAWEVPLSSLAMAGLEMLKESCAGHEKICFSATSKTEIMSLDSPRLKIKIITGKELTAHGVRSVFAGWAEAEGIDDVLIERSLMHRPVGQVRQAYRRETHTERRREVMQKWADFLTNVK